MIFGRPADLFATAVTALFNLLVLMTVATAEATTLAVFDTLAAILTPVVITGVNLCLGAWIAFLAFQPPTVNPGDQIVITTPVGEPNYQTTVATPPAASPPPTPVPGTE